MFKTHAWLVVALAVTLVAVGACSPAAPTGTPTVAPTATAASSPTASPTLSYDVFVAAEAQTSFEIPQGWERTDIAEGISWSPPGRPSERVGLRWADLQPPQEPEAVLLPQNAQVLDSASAQLAWAEGGGRRIRLGLLDTPTPGAGQARTRAVETHILGAVASAAGQRAYDLFASAADAVTLEQLQPVLDRMVQSFTLGPGGSPTTAVGDYRAVTVTEAGIFFEIPEGWPEAQSTDGTVNVTTWTSPENAAQQLGFKWQLVRPPSEPEVDLLPNRPTIVQVEAVNLPWARGNRYQVENYGEVPKESGQEAPLVSVSRYITLVLQRGDQIFAYAFFATAPTAAELQPLEPEVEIMLSSAGPLPFE